MRNSSLLKWTQNNKNGSKLLNSNNNKNKKDEDKKWIHAPETLLHGNVVYLVKFLGCTEVDKPKGIEIVKQGIQKLKFNQQLTKKGESGGKTPKAELTINVEGVVIQEPKTKKVLHQYPLHKISYCADDKAEKRFFSFIAKEEFEENTGVTAVKHTCFVFVSDKLAEEITLTIGQAFELAYKKFLDINSKEMETKKSLLVLQKRVSLLERENGILKTRLRDVASIKGQQSVQDYMHRNDITGDICDVMVSLPSQSASSNEASPSNTLTLNTSKSNAPQDDKKNQKSDELICLEITSTKLDGFSLDDLNDDDFNPRGLNSESDSGDENDFNPRAESSSVGTSSKASVFPTNLLSPPPRDKSASSVVSPSTDANIFPAVSTDPFADQNPFQAKDPFGMSSFEANQAFKATTNFSLDELDPFKL